MLVEDLTSDEKIFEFLLIECLTRRYFLFSFLTFCISAALLFGISLGQCNIAVLLLASGFVAVWLSASIYKQRKYILAKENKLLWYLTTLFLALIAYWVTGNWKFSFSYVVILHTFFVTFRFLCVISCGKFLQIRIGGSNDGLMDRRTLFNCLVFSLATPLSFLAVFWLVGPKLHFLIAIAASRLFLVSSCFEFAMPAVFNVLFIWALFANTLWICLLYFVENRLFDFLFLCEVKGVLEMKFPLACLASSENFLYKCVSLLTLQRIIQDQQACLIDTFPQECNQLIETITKELTAVADKQPVVKQEEQKTFSSLPAWLIPSKKATEQAQMKSEITFSATHTQKEYYDLLLHGKPTCFFIFSVLGLS